MRPPDHNSGTSNRRNFKVWLVWNRKCLFNAIFCDWHVFMRNSKCTKLPSDAPVVDCACPSESLLCGLTFLLANMTFPCKLLCISHLELHIVNVHVYIIFSMFFFYKLHLHRRMYTAMGNCNSSAVRTLCFLFDSHSVTKRKFSFCENEPFVIVLSVTYVGIRAT